MLHNSLREILFWFYDDTLQAAQAVVTSEALQSAEPVKERIEAYIGFQKELDEWYPIHTVQEFLEDIGFSEAEMVRFFNSLELGNR